jgi:hypothetical protein
LSRWLLAIVAVLSALAPAAAKADDNAIVFSGAQFDFSNYVFAGVTVALPGSSIGSGFALRGYVDSGGYDYISQDLGPIKATFSGEELDVVYQITHKGFWSNIGLGLNASNTGLEPYDPKNLLRGEQVEPRVSLDGGDVGGPWRADWDGYYGTRLQDYQAMLGVTHALTAKWRLGAEVYGSGNPNYRLRQAGPYAGLSFDDRSELQVSSGGAWESGYTPRIYVSASYFRRF